MGKRFGRNQKRAMREQIRQNKQCIDTKNQSILELKRMLNESNTVIERTSQVLGDHFVTLPVKTVAVKEILERFQVSIFQPHRSYAINSAVIQALDLIDIIDIDTYQASLNVDELRGTVHMRYQSINGSVGYGLSEHAWRKLSEAHLIDLLTKQIAPEMAKHLIKNRNNRSFN
jgi:hypothetical protein